MQFLTVCLLGCFRHFQVKKHISGMCWFDPLSEALKQLWSNFHSIGDNGLRASSVPLLWCFFPSVI